MRLVVGLVDFEVNCEVVAVISSGADDGPADLSATISSRK